MSAKFYVPHSRGASLLELRLLFSVLASGTFLLIPVIWIFRDYFLDVNFDLYAMLAAFILLSYAVYPKISLSSSGYLCLPVIYFLGVFVINLAHILSPPPTGQLLSDYPKHNLLVLVTWLFALLSGIAMSKLSASTALRLTLFVLAANAICIFSLKSETSLALAAEFLNGDSGALYLNLADHLVLTAAFVIAISPVWLAVSVASLTFLLLLILASRAALIVFIIFCLLRPIWSKNTSLAILLAPLIGLAMFSVYSILISSSDGRISSFLLNFSEDRSLLERFEQLGLGLQNISENILLGDYFFIPREFGGYGHYIHSAISHIQIYGLLAAMPLVILYFIMGIWLLKAMDNTYPTKIRSQLLLILPIVLTLGVFARGYTWGLDFFVFAYFCSKISSFSRMASERGNAA